MSCSTKRLAWKSTAQDIKFSFEIFPIKCAKISIDFKLIHPAVFLALF